jgi:methylthioribose-1-phosphate isomerase
MESLLLKPIEWLPEGKVRFLDQTRLPQDEVWVETDDVDVVAEAIRRLQVRGAPLIGIAAAYGLALVAVSGPEDSAELREALEEAAATLKGTRPTAVNLAWAVDRVLETVPRGACTDEARLQVIREAQRIHDEDIEGNMRMGEHGASLLPPNARVMTHCNAGALATGGYGTALGVIRAAWEHGNLEHVIVNETRPLLQGARLTAWELGRDGIPHTLIVDGAAGSMMQREHVDAVVVGADRIAANGDVANKIGTYQVAALAKRHGIPFYVAAPKSTIDLAAAEGAAIPIEERAEEEVTSFREARAAAPGTSAANPAFDVTPADLVTAIVTENGVATAPYGESLTRICESKAAVRG